MIRREGPSFTRWLYGRVAYPSHPGRCAACGTGVIDTEVVRELARAGDRRLAAFVKLCSTCRRAMLRRELASR